MKQYLWNERVTFEFLKVIESVIVPFLHIFFLDLLLRSCVFTLELFLFGYQGDITLVSRLPVSWEFTRK